MKWSVAVVVSFATLLPVWGQQQGTVTITLPNVMAGVDASDSNLTWITTVRLVNRTTGLHNWIIVVDPEGVSPGVKVTFANGNTGVIGGMYGYTSPLGEERFIFEGVDSQAVAKSIKVTARSRSGDDGSPDMVASALVQQRDQNGKILNSYESVDSSTVSTAPGTGFAVPLDLQVDGVDTALLFSNPGNGGVTVTIAVYDGNNTATSIDGRVPVGKVDVVVPPRGTLAQTLGQLFANADFGGFFNDPHNFAVQQLLVITSDQPFGIAVVRSNMGSDGSLTATAANAFPLAQ